MFGSSEKNRSTRSTLLVPLIFLAPQPIHAAEQTTSARFRAGEILLEKITQQITDYDYPGIKTDDLPELMKSYLNLLSEFKETLRNSDQLSQTQKSQFSFFCTLGMANIKGLIQREAQQLLLPRIPGETPDHLRRLHAKALSFFSEQHDVAQLIPNILGCPESPASK